MAIRRFAPIIALILLGAAAAATITAPGNDLYAIGTAHSFCPDVPADGTLYGPSGVIATNTTADGCIHHVLGEEGLHYATWSNGETTSLTAYRPQTTGTDGWLLIGLPSLAVTIYGATKQRIPIMMAGYLGLISYLIPGFPLGYQFTALLLPLVIYLDSWYQTKTKQETR